MADAPKILKTDTLRQAFPKLNQSVDNANMALRKAHEVETSVFDAIDTAARARTKAESIQAQFDKIVVEGDSSPAVTQALIGTPYNSLREKHEAIDTELTSATTNVLRLNSEVIGIKPFDFEIWYPPEFPKEKVPFRIFKDVDGVYKHDFDINSKLIDAKHIYVSGKGGQGSDTTGDGLTLETCVTTLNKAVQIANGLPDKTVIINVMNPLVDKDRGMTTVNFAPNKNIIVKPYQDLEQIIFTSADLDLTYTADENVFFTSKTAVNNVFDVKYKNSDGTPRIYKKATSLANVKATRGSYFIDGSNNVYVHTLDGRKPDNTIILNRTMNPSQWTINGKELIFCHCLFMMSHPSLDAMKVTGDELSTLINYKCTFAFGGANGLAVLKVGKTFSFDCVATENGNDGFNYHGVFSDNPYMFAFEYNCRSYKNGWQMTGNNNATTAHEGMYIMRVNCVGYDCDGPICADVNGCYSLLYGCIMYNSTRSSASTKTGYWFDSTSGRRTAKAWLIDCKGDSEYSINADASTQLFVKRFAGNKIPSHILSKIVLIN